MVERAQVGRPRARLAVGLAAAAVCVGLVVGLVTWLGGTGEHGGSGPRLPLVGIGAGALGGRWTEDGAWVTGMPLVLRNASGAPIELLSVEPLHTRGVEVGRDGVVGPQREALGVPAALVGWPPDSPDRGRGTPPPFTAEDVVPIRGYRIPSGPRTAASPPTAADGSLADLPNDARPVFQLRRLPDARVGAVEGIRVRYRLRRTTRVQVFRQVRLELCDRGTFENPSAGGCSG